MARVLKYIGVGLAVLVGIVLLAVVAVNWIPGDTYKSLIASGVQSATGREMVIEGDLDIDLFTTFSFRASGIKLANPAWASRPNMVTVDHVEAELALFPLLAGMLDFSLIVKKPDLLLEQNSSGQGNWQFGKPAEAPAEKETATEAEEPEKAPGLPLRPVVRNLLISGARIAFQDAQKKEQFRIHGESIQFDPASGELTVRVDGHAKKIPIALTGGFEDVKTVADKVTAKVRFDGHFGDAKLAVTGSVGPFFPAAEMDVTMDVGVDSVADLSSLAGRDLPDLGPLSVSVRLIGQKGTYRVEKMLAKLEDETLHLEANGSVADLAALDGLQLGTTVATEQLTELAKMAGVPVPFALPDQLNASVEAAGSLKKLTVKDFKVSLAGRNLAVAGSGTVGNVMKLEAVKADLSMEAASLDWFAEIAKAELPALAPVKAIVAIESEGENLENVEVKADLAATDIHAIVNASVVEPLQKMEIQSDARVRVESFAWLASYLQKELPPLGPLNASVHVASQDGIFGARDISVDLDGKHVQAEIAGNVNDLFHMTGIDANIDVTLDSMATLGSLTQKELPDTGPISLKAEVSGEGGIEKPIRISAEVQADGVQANLDGSIAKPLQAQGIEMTITADAESLEKIGALTGVSIQGEDPLRFTGRLIRDENKIEVSSLDLGIGDADVKGEVMLLLPAETEGRPKLEGELHAGVLDLTKWEKKEVPPETPSDTETAEPEVKKEKLFSSEPIPFGPLKALDADLELTVKSLTTQLILIEDLSVGLKLDKGLLKVQPLQAKVGEGVLDGTVTLDAGQRPATFSKRIEMTDATLRNFGGRIHFLADLEGSGESVASIMGGLNGHLVFDVRDAVLKESLMTNFGSGMLSALNPFDKEEETTDLNCAIILFDIEDGMADANRKIALQMSDVTWFGSGEIDLKTEEIDFGMKPKSRKALDVGIGGLAGLVHVGGTLAAPKIQLDPKDVAKKYAKRWAFLATGGLSFLVDKALSTAKANTDVCTQILEQIKNEE